MKIIYAAPHTSVFPSRAANTIHMMRMCEAFSGLGHEVVLLASSSGRSQEEIFDFYGMSPVFTIERLVFPSGPGRSIIFAMSAARKAMATAPALVVGRSTQICALTAFFGVPTVYDSHEPVWKKDLVERLAYRMLYRNRNLVRMTTNSRALKKLFEAQKLVPGCGIVAAHNGSLEFPLGEMAQVWPGRAGVVQAGYVGHLYPGRGVDVIIGCARIMSGVDFHIVGGVETDIAYWREQAELANLFFHGFVKHSEVYRYRNNCQVLLAPYQARNVTMTGGKGDSSTYMNPIKIIEYLSSRKPIIASDLPVLREILEHERNALLCPPDDVHAWVRCLERLRDDPGLGKQLAAAAYDDFVTKYTWARRAQAVLGDRA